MNARRALALAAGLVAGSIMLQAAAAAPVGWSPSHEAPWLVVRGQPVILAYGFHGSSRFPRAGAIYVRNSLQRSFTRLPLVKSSDLLVARVPARLVAGARLVYYAVLRDPGSGRSVTIPAAGASRPQRVWIVNRLLAVSLGAHQFGHLRAPDAIVASAGPRDVGFECGKPSACSSPESAPNEGCGCIDVLPQGPSSFDVARNGSIWLLDELNHRLLVWASGRPIRSARAIQLPAALAYSDFALGPRGTIYLFATDLGSGHRSLWALTPTGHVRWKAPIGNGVLRIGPGGLAYAVGAYEDDPAAWTPLTTAAGRPLSLAQQRRRTTRFQPLPGGLRLVTVWQSSHEVRFALVNRADAVVRAWRVTSKTQFGSGWRATPALVGRALVVTFDVSQQIKGKSLVEHLVVRLTSTGGTRQTFALDGRAVFGDSETYTAPLRVGSDGRLYQLRTDPETGASVARYSLGR
jgi:hypothetical protein